MKSYILVGILSFLSGLFLSLFKYISFEWIILLLIIFCLGVKFLIDSNVLPTNTIKFLAPFVLPKILQFIKPTKQKTNPEKIVKIDSDKVIIKFDHKGTSRYHAVPYSRKKLANHSKYEVHLIGNDKKEIEITQIPGTSYKHSANELNCEAIRVTNKITKEFILYEGDDIPNLNRNE